MRRVSLKRQRLMRQVKGVRANIVEERGPRCQICRRVRPLACHEIARGVNRSKALGCRFAILAVCSECNTGTLCRASEWPMPRQLALLMLASPDDYDLGSFNGLISPNQIFQAEVDRFVIELRKEHYGDIFDERAAG